MISLEIFCDGDEVTMRNTWKTEREFAAMWCSLFHLLNGFENMIRQALFLSDCVWVRVCRPGLLYMRFTIDPQGRRVSEFSIEGDRDDVVKVFAVLFKGNEALKKRVRHYVDVYHECKIDYLDLTLKHMN